MSQTGRDALCMVMGPGPSPREQASADVPPKGELLE